MKLTVAVLFLAVLALAQTKLPAQWTNACTSGDCFVGALIAELPDNEKIRRLARPCGVCLKIKEPRLVVS